MFHKRHSVKFLLHIIVTSIFGSHDCHLRRPHDVMINRQHASIVDSRVDARFDVRQAVCHHLPIISKQFTNPAQIVFGK